MRRLPDGYRMVETGYGGVTMKTLDVRVGADGAIDSMYVSLYNPLRPGSAPEFVELIRHGSTVRARESKRPGRGANAAGVAWTVGKGAPGTEIALLSPAGVEGWLRAGSRAGRGRHDFRGIDPLMEERGTTIEFLGPSRVLVANGGSTEDYRIDGDGRILTGSSDVGIEFTCEAWVDPAHRRGTAGRSKGR